MPQSPVELRSLPRQKGLRWSLGDSDEFHLWIENDSVYTDGKIGAIGPVVGGSARLAGGQPSGAPLAGNFQASDFIANNDGSLWICTVGGNPGTWTQIAGIGFGFIPNVATAGNLVFSDALTQIVPGATSLSIRNHADAVDNFLVTDAGNAQLLLSLAIGGPSPWYDVTHPKFGAVGNGVADDTAAIQAAINAAITAGGGSIFLPKGIYKLTSTLVMQMGLHIRIFSPTTEGGTSATILRWAGAAGGTVLFMNRTQDCLIRGLSFVSSSGSHNFGVGIDVDQTTGSGIATDCTFEWLSFTIPTNGIGMRFANTSSSNVERMSFVHCQFTGPNGTTEIGVQTKHNQTNTYSYYDCSFNTLGYGIQATGASYSCYSCNFGNNNVADNDLVSNAAANFYQCTSQSSPAFLTSGGSSSPSNVLISGMNATPDQAIGTWLRLGYGGSLTLINCDFAQGSNNNAWRIDTSQAGRSRLFAAGCIFPNNAFVAVVSGAMRFTILSCTYIAANGAGVATILQDVINGVTNASGGGSTGLMAFSSGGLASGTGSTNTAGLRLVGGGLSVQKIPAPIGLALAVTGANNGVTYSYYVVAIDVTGKKSLASATVTTVLGPTTLDANNFIKLTWTETSGAVAYDIIRSAGGVAQGSIFLLAAVDALAGVIDNGLVATVYTPLLRSTSADSTIQGVTKLSGLAPATQATGTTYTVTLDDYLVLATGAGPFTVTLPTAPPDGFEVIVKAPTGAANTITVSRGGSTDQIELAGASANTRTLTTNGASIALIYNSAAQLWYTTATQGTVT